MESRDSFVKKLYYSNFKLFKIFGKDADYMIRGLTKNNDGKYNSRKIRTRGL